MIKILMTYWFIKLSDILHEFSEILSSIQGNFRGRSATKIFPSVDEYLFLFQEENFMSIEKGPKQ